MVAQTQKLITMNTDKTAILSRIKEIEQEDKNTMKPRLGVNSIEDVDDLYQARLEYNWWFDELNTEFKNLTEEAKSIEQVIFNNLNAILGA